jgi:hypothetical protein
VDVTERQWVSYRVVPWAMLAAPLPSAPPVGDGWRGVDLRRLLPTGRLDQLVIDTATRSEAALGFHVEATFAYVIGAGGGAEPVRLVLGTDAAAEGRARDVLTLAGSTGTGARWRKQASRAFETWSGHAPRQVDAKSVLALMGPEHPPAEAASWLCALIGIAPPNEPIPDPLDLQSLARQQLQVEPGASQATRRWFSRGR